MKKNMSVGNEINILKELLAPVGVIMTHLPGYNPNDNPDGWIWELVDVGTNQWRRVR